MDKAETGKSAQSGGAVAWDEAFPAALRHRFFAVATNHDPAGFRLSPSTAAGSKPSGAPCGIAQFVLNHLTCQERMLQQLRNLVAFANEVGLATQVFHEYDHFPAISGVDHSGIAHQPLLRH